MKSSEFKQLIKEAVKEVFREEMKEIILEAIRSSKESTITENKYTVLPNIDLKRMESPRGTGDYIPPQPYITSSPEVRQNLREQYMNILGETEMSFNTSNVPFNPIGADPINGELPQGELNINQIMGILNTK